ncbi:MAG: sugar ABC transporter substrate-binding protein [Bdellovibrio sp.]|nr:MAG: sugar ABC transporter substrate-binding protein [Bdellovibrio sp.]
MLRAGIASFVCPAKSPGTLARCLVRKLLCFLAVTVTALSVGRQGLGEDKALSIAVIPMGSTHEYWKSIHAGAAQAAQELKVDILWKGPLREDDRNSQIDLVEDMIAKRVSGIVLAPIDGTALSRPVGNAAGVGIPVVIVDAALNSDKIVSFIATDNYKGGVLAGDHLAQLLHNKGQVIMLRGLEGSASTMAREQGFLDTVKKYPGMSVVSSNQHGGITTETGYQASENLLNAYKSKTGDLSIDGIFCPNESTTFGMLRALQDNGYAGKVRFIGFDSSAKLVEAVGKGQIDALVVQDPQRMGYLGIKTLVGHLKGEKIDRRIDTGATVVTSKNMNEQKIHDLLHPDLKRWLK